jgi:stage II sporulation protein AA (anti-sigma F factor antagonist)
MQSFHLSEREISSDCREIRVEGELDLAVAGRLEEAIARCRGKETLIDLAGCEFIDSTGIAVIVRAGRERARDGGGRLVVHSPTDQVLRVLEITGLTDIGLVFASRDEALGEPALQE